MDADFRGDKGRIQHDHDLSEGYSDACPTCNQEVKDTAQHLKVLLVLYASPRLSNVKHRLGEAIKALEKAQSIFDEIGFEINVTEWDQLRALPAELADQTKALHDRFPSRSNELIARQMEFVLACYVDIYGSLPAPYAVRDESGLKEFAFINKSTQFTHDCWKLAREEAREDIKLELKMFPPIVKRYQKAIPTPGADIQSTMREVLKRWGNSPPKPQDLFAYNGDISVWSGE